MKWHPIADSRPAPGRIGWVTGLRPDGTRFYVKAYYLPSPGNEWAEYVFLDGDGDEIYPPTHFLADGPWIVRAPNP